MRLPFGCGWSSGRILWGLMWCALFFRGRAMLLSGIGSSLVIAFWWLGRLLAAVLRIDGGEGKTFDLVTDGQWQVRKPDSTWSAAKDLGGLTDLRLGTGPDRLGQAVAPPERVSSSASLFRREFVAPGAVVSARLYITAMGSYRASLNGKPVSDAVLTPDFTDYRKRVTYQTYDVTSMVQSGSNTLGVLLGSGWYGSGLTWAGAYPFGTAAPVLAQMVIETEDGEAYYVGYGFELEVAESPILNSEIYAGEAYDARLETGG